MNYFITCIRPIFIFMFIINALVYYSTGANAEVNTRTFMPSGSSNKIMHMRIQAMTMDDEMKDKLFGDGHVSIGKKEDGCKLSIGNQTDTGLGAKPQDIYIDGPIINYCR